MKNFKIVLVLGGLFALVAIIGLIFLVLSKHTIIKNPQVSSVNSNTAVDNSNNNAAESTTSTYKNNDYSFDYPKNLDSAKIAQTYLPYGNLKINTDFAYFHSINTEYCAPSGKCTPTTDDLWFEGGIISSSISEVKNKLGAEAKSINLGDKEILTFSQGVEGEGRNYYFVATPTGKTLMFSQKYIDESIVIKYAKLPEFMKLSDQNQTMKDIISSLKFNK